MPYKQRPAALPACACKQDIRTVHHVNHFLPCVKGNIGKGHQAQRQRRQRQMMQPLPAAHLAVQHTDRRREANRKPAKLHRKHQQQNKPQPERRHTAQKIADPPEKLVLPVVTVYAHDAAEQKSNTSRKHPRTQHEGKRILKTLCDNSNDGPAVQKRHAKVPAKQRAKPANITRRRRLVSPPVCRNLSPLRLRHRSDSQNILLHRVYWRRTHQGKRQYTDCQEQCNDSYAVFEKQRHQYKHG